MKRSQVPSNKHVNSFSTRKYSKAVYNEENQIVGYIRPPDVSHSNTTAPSINVYEHDDIDQSDFSPNVDNEIMENNWQMDSHFIDINNDIHPEAITTSSTEESETAFMNLLINRTTFQPYDLFNQDNSYFRNASQITLPGGAHLKLTLYMFLFAILVICNSLNFSYIALAPLLQLIQLGLPNDIKRHFPVSIADFDRKFWNVLDLPKEKHRQWGREEAERNSSDRDMTTHRKWGSYTSFDLPELLKLQFSNPDFLSNLHDGITAY
jgi:hypothetical protein